MPKKRRRGHGEGSVFQRADGRWVARVSTGYAKGKRLRRDYYAGTQQEALRKLAQARRTLDDGLPLPDERQRVGQFLESWLEDVARRTVRASTYIRYRQLLVIHVMPEIGRHPLKAVTPQLLQSLYARREEEVSPRTVGHVHRLLHRALSDAVAWGLIVRNPCALVKPPRVPAVEMRHLSVAEAQAFLEAARGDPLEAFYVLAVTAGLRLGELSGLHWDDMDLGAGTLQVRRSARRIGGKWSELEPKSKASRRLVQLSGVAVEKLAAHRSAQVVRSLQNLVFTSPGGGYLDPSWLMKRSFRPLLARAGLPRIRFHDLRHTAASLLLAKGVHPKVVQEILGHSGFAITMDTYSHIAPHLQREAADIMDALFRR
jgi:integrase